MTTVYIIYDDKKEVRKTHVVSFSITYTANEVPTANLTMTADMAPYLMRKCEILVDSSGESILLSATAADVDFGDGTVSITTEHIFNEWTTESIPINVAKKSASIRSLMTDKVFIYKRHEWDIRFDKSPELDAKFDYEFSRETKQDALNKIIDMSPHILKRFPRNTERTLELGQFGEHKEFRIHNGNLKSQPSMTMDGTNIKNLIVPIVDKADGGATSLTLRDLAVNPTKAVLPDFPIVNTGNVINTQSTKVGYDFPQFAPNNMNEWAVLDKFGLAMEHGEIYEGTYSASDLQPVQVEGKTIKNEDRIKATETLYRTTVRVAQNSRRTIKFDCDLIDLPHDVDVLDKVKLDFKAVFPNMVECLGTFEKEIFCETDWWYVTMIQMDLTDCGWTYKISVAKTLAGILGSRLK